jgi:hypothetical protein
MHLNWGFILGQFCGTLLYKFVRNWKPGNWRLMWQAIKDWHKREWPWQP